METGLTPLHAGQAFAECEALWHPADARETIRRLFEQAYADFSARVMVLDDDPTGVQTVHDITVLTAWDVETLTDVLSGGERLFFVLANSRSFSVERAAHVHREIARNAAQAARNAGVELLIISRGDSTLRGHYPLETHVLRQALEDEGWPAFSGEVLCPFFKEGGRFTIGGVHYVREGERLIPAAQTEFARDKTFGYAHYDLAGYIREKSGERVSEEQIVRITLRDIRGLHLDAIGQRLLNVQGYHYIVADAAEEADVQALAIVLMRLMKRGRHYLSRSAAAVPKVFGHVADRPLLSREEINGADSTVGGLVLVGSHVQKTTDQLNCLRESAVLLTFIEFHVDGWQTPDGLADETRRAVALAEASMREGRTAVVYTSRQLVLPQDASPEELLAISVRISGALTNVVGTLSIRPRFLIAKGGITSSDVGTKALRVKRARGCWVRRSRASLCGRRAWKVCFPVCPTSFSPEMWAMYPPCGALWNRCPDRKRRCHHGKKGHHIPRAGEGRNAH